MSDGDASDVTFKRCTNCKYLWRERDDFLGDPLVELIGYQAWLPDPELGLVLFNHHECGTTMALEARAFEDLFDGPVYEASKHGSEECFGFCDDEQALESCPAECACAWVREVLQILRRWPKGSDRSTTHG